MTGRGHSSLYTWIGLIALLALGTVSCSKDMSEPSTELAKVSGPHIMFQASFGAEESSSARTMELLAGDICLDGKDTTYLKRDPKVMEPDVYDGRPPIQRGFGQGILEEIRPFDFGPIRLPFAQEGTEKVYFIFLQGEKRFVSEATLRLKATNTEWGTRYYAELMPVALPAGLDPSSSEEIIMTGAIGIESIDPSTGYIKVKSPGVFRAGDRIPTLPMFFPAQKIEAKHLTGELPIQANFRFLGGLIVIPMFRELDKRFYPETLDMGLNYEESPFITEGVIDLLSRDISFGNWSNSTKLQSDERVGALGDIDPGRYYESKKPHADSVIYADSYSPRTISVVNNPKAKVAFGLSHLGEMGRESSSAYNSKTPRYTGSVYAAYVYSRPVHELTRDSAWVFTVPPIGWEEDYTKAIYPAPAPGNGHWRYFWVASQSGRYKGKPISVYGSYIDNTSTGATRKKFCMLSQDSERWGNKEVHREIDYGWDYAIYGNYYSLSGRAVKFGSFHPLYKTDPVTIEGVTYDNFLPIRVLKDATWHPGLPDGYHY